MFFTLSKTAGFLAVPSHALIVLLLIGVVLLFTRFQKTARFAVTFGVLMLTAAAFTQIGSYLLRPLEERFPAFAPDQAPVAGIIVLGGAVDPDPYYEAGRVSVNESAERITHAVALARLYPQAQIIYVSGNARLDGGTGPESRAAQELLLALGIEPSRIVIEENSRNTYENAVNVKALLNPDPAARYLLVTSAFHMPRSMGCFRSAGFPVTAAPADQRMGAAPDPLATFAYALTGLSRTDTAVREWIGLLTYWATGKTPDLFPSP